MTAATSIGQEGLWQVLYVDHRVLLDEIDQRGDAVGEHLAGHAEAALDGADVGDAARALLEDGEALAAQAAAQGVGGVEREAALALHVALEGAADFAGRQLLDELAVETDVLDGAHNLVARVGEQVQAGFLDVVEGDGSGHGRNGFHLRR